jgi:hypothetical protein
MKCYNCFIIFNIPRSDVTEESDVSDEREEEEEETKDDKVRTYLPLMVTIPSLVENVESFN